MFAIFFPQDGHAPGITPDGVKKIIVKVKVILNSKYHNKSNKDNKEVKQINCDNIRYSFDE